MVGYFGCQYYFFSRAKRYKDNKKFEKSIKKKSFYECSAWSMLFMVCYMILVLFPSLSIPQLACVLLAYAMVFAHSYTCTRSAGYQVH